MIAEPTTEEGARVRIWIVRPGAIDEPGLLERYRSVLSREERARLARRPMSTARQFLVTRVLVRWALSRATRVPVEAWQFEEDDRGKPRVVGPSDVPPPSFNVSHSGELVVCAVASGLQVGVDVEDLERERGFVPVAERFFAAREAAEVRGLTGVALRTRFYQYWTLKESYIKARGLGISLPLSAFWFELEADAPPRISFDDRIEDDPEAWRFWQERVADRHLAALAVRCGRDVDLEVEVRETTPFADEPHG